MARMTKTMPCAESAITSKNIHHAIASDTPRATAPGTSAAGSSIMPPRGRFAPTPSGRMHLGNVWCALAAWLAVRSQGGTLVLRIEDLDKRKIPTGAEEALIADLRWLGLDWDEGPVRQSDRTAVYAAQVARLDEAGLTYPCFCTLAELHSAEAPHASDGTPIYPGTCRGLSEGQVAHLRATRPRPPATRLVVPRETDPAGIISFDDATYGPQRECLAQECGDFLVRRGDGVFAYQLAVTVDDALMGVTQVVRGRDLLPSTARQIYLQRLLGFSRPSYAHIPLLLSADGTRRLSKRDNDCDLGFMREHFGRPEILLGRLAKLVGLRETDEPASAAELLDGFSWNAWARHLGTRGDIAVPGSFFC